MRSPALRRDRPYEQLNEGCRSVDRGELGAVVGDEHREQARRLGGAGIRAHRVRTTRRLEPALARPDERTD